MIVVLPGQPPSRLQGLTTAFWNGQQYNAYISGNAFSILRGPERFLQTVHNDDDIPLDAISIDEVTGKIATCTFRRVRIYQPNVLRGGSVQWAQCSAFDVPHATPEAICALSWGGSEELMVASNFLALFSTSHHSTKLWERRLPNPAKYAALSHESALVASVGHHDHLVKVWRRLIYAADEVKFDVTLLQHADVVTSIRWRRPFHPDQGADNVLYTTCTDNLVRIWAPIETLEGRQWQLRGCVDMNVAPEITGEDLHAPLVMFIDGRDFTAAVERALKDRMADDQSTDDAALDHLVAIANRNPEMCIQIDSMGILSAWALENVEADDREPFRAFIVAQISSPQVKEFGSFLRNQVSASRTHAEVQAYCDRSTGKLVMLLHSFDGRIGVFVSHVADLLDPLANNRRFSLQTVWTGHTAAIKKFARNFSGQVIVSLTDSEECILWKSSPKSVELAGQTLSRSAVIPYMGTIYHICILQQGKFVVLHYGTDIILWDCRSESASAIAKHNAGDGEKPLCLIGVPRPQTSSEHVAHVVIIMPNGRGLVYEIKLPQRHEIPAESGAADISEFCRFSFEAMDDLGQILSVDPVGRVPVASEFLDKFAQDVAVSYTQSGRVNFWAARLNAEGRGIAWLSTSCTETNFVNAGLLSGCVLKKAALVDDTRSQLTVWDIGSSRLEYDNSYDASDKIQDLDWTSTPDAQAILAIGFQHRIILLCQKRFDYLNKGPAWAAIHEIKSWELTGHPIGDSAWLADGHLIMGAGNQLLVYDGTIGINQSSTTIFRRSSPNGQGHLFRAVRRLNGPLPVFHPQLLSQCVIAGKGCVVRGILSALHRTLKFLVAGEAVDDYLGLPLSHFFMSDSGEYHETAGSTPISHQQGDTDMISADVAAFIKERLTKLRLPQLSGQEQMQLADIVECASIVETHRRSMDENGIRYMLFARQHTLRKGRDNDSPLGWRDFNWAFHSGSQDVLLDFVSRQNHGTILWEQAQEYGIFMWLADSAKVRDYFEVVARNEYTKREVKNPVDCSLFYIALRKKTVLQGLWRMASWNKEQGATQKLLANNFDEPKWRTTALKNAYALLSKRRFHYAAAFFLLANHLEDAVEVCLRQLKDLQLAVAVARVYEGDAGPVLRRLIQEEVLAIAAQEGNRWLASWAFWMLSRKDMAVRALIMPVPTLLETPSLVDIKSRLFLTDDPALAVLYSQLRHQTVQTLHGASKVTPRIEWEFVLHSAKLYDRMGCDLLGLDLVRNWEFQRPATWNTEGDLNPLSLLRRRSSLVTDDVSSTASDLSRRLAQERPKVSSPVGLTGAVPFVEPDASSLLDSFGL